MEKYTMDCDNTVEADDIVSDCLGERLNELEAEYKEKLDKLKIKYTARIAALKAAINEFSNDSGNSKKTRNGEVLRVVRNVVNRIEKQSFTTTDVFHEVQKTHANGAPNRASLSYALSRLADNGALVIKTKGKGKRPTEYTKPMKVEV